MNITEGIKEKERAVMHKILQQIATIKDNCYLLRRHMWNDVNEDWPFYTEEEKRMLKRSVSFDMLVLIAFYNGCYHLCTSLQYF